MKLKFRINKYYLVSHTISSYNQFHLTPFTGWKKLEKKLWKKYKNEPAYYLLNPKHVNWALEQIYSSIGTEGVDKAFIKITQSFKKILKDILKSPEFKRLLKETNNYLFFVKKQWRENRKIALEIIEKLSGLKIPQRMKVTVFITHPKLRSGINVPEKNLVFWGHPEEWRNYSTIYICHELMHILTYKKYSHANVMHALIELMTDEELRIRLNNKGFYFKEGKKFIGHKSLLPLKKKILPFWKKYLKGKLADNIYELEKLLIRKLKVKGPSFKRWPS